MAQVRAECSSCGGTGLYAGMAEPPGVAVICFTCSGTGAEIISYTPFTKRKQKRGIKKVQRSAGRFILGPIGPHGRSITYEQFAAGVMP